MTPADVVASINYHRGEKSTSAVKPFADTIETIAIDGDNVVFTLSEGNADFPYIIGEYHFAIMPATEGKTTGNPALAPAPIRSIILNRGTSPS